jgi:hypothetical protein
MPGWPGTAARSATPVAARIVWILTGRPSRVLDRHHSTKVSGHSGHHTMEDAVGISTAAPSHGPACRGR